MPSTVNLRTEGNDLVVTRYDNYQLDNLKPYAKNAKIHTDEQIAHLARSIEMFGFQQPIVVDEHDVIIAGHGRWLAAQKIKLSDAPVWRVDGYSDEQKEAFRIADNSINQETGFDVEIYEQLLESLRGSDFPIEDLGLEPQALDVAPDDVDVADFDEGDLQARITLKLPNTILDNFEHHLDQFLEDFPEVKKTKAV